MPKNLHLDITHPVQVEPMPAISQAGGAERKMFLGQSMPKRTISIR